MITLHDQIEDVLGNIKNKFRLPLLDSMKTNAQNAAQHVIDKYTIENIQDASIWYDDFTCNKICNLSHVFRSNIFDAYDDETDELHNAIEKIVGHCMKEFLKKNDYFGAVHSSWSWCDHSVPFHKITNSSSKLLEKFNKQELNTIQESMRNLRLLWLNFVIEIVDEIM